MINVKLLSPVICIDDPVKSRDFYVNTFGAKVKFDCGWYIIVSLNGHDLCFMAPQTDEQEKFDGKGLVYNIEVDDVDAEYNKLVTMGLKAVMPLEDHPWGDRGFAVLDPNGVQLYIYSPREPDEEFKQYLSDNK
ncbi:MAG: glyoxalase [Alphaproteobacteria bacterium]|nr:glyoxalase [Alphaproteobacteria bacterium]